MENLDNILKHFNNNMNSWVSFLNEKINDGGEISRGKNPIDQSKEQKLINNPNYQRNEYDPVPENGAVPPIIDPSQAPGSQISIGRKHIPTKNDPESVRIEISQTDKDTIDTTPVLDIQYPNGPY